MMLHFTVVRLKSDHRAIERIDHRASGWTSISGSVVFTMYSSEGVG